MACSGRSSVGRQTPDRSAKAGPTSRFGWGTLRYRAQRRIALPRLLARGGVGQAGVQPSAPRLDRRLVVGGRAGEQPGLSKGDGDGQGHGLRLPANACKRQGDGSSGRSWLQRQIREVAGAPTITASRFSPVEGALTIDGREMAVTGRAWMDREWSSQPSAPPTRRAGTGSRCIWRVAKS